MPLRRRARRICAPSPRSGRCTSIRTVRNHAMRPRCANADSPWGRGRDGLIPIRGQLLPEVAAQLQRIFDSLLNPKLDGPRFADTTGPTSDADGCAAGRAGAEAAVAGSAGYGHGAGEPGGGDAQRRHGTAARPGRHAHPRTEAARRPRHRPQRRRPLRRAARHRRRRTDLGCRRPRRGPRLPAADTRRSTARTSPSPIAVARHTACDGGVQRVISDDAGRIIAIHTLDRVFNHHQRKAITLRDGGCIIPGCRVPAGWCEIHHVTDHARGGPTHTDNGVLLCWHHHRTLDTNGWAIRMDHGVPNVRGPALVGPAPALATRPPRPQRGCSTGWSADSDEHQHVNERHASPRTAARPTAAAPR